LAPSHPIPLFTSVRTFLVLSSIPFFLYDILCSCA
jgi:hypothetical protein